MAIREVPLKIIPREEWGGGPTEAGAPLRPPVQYLIVTLETPTFKCVNAEECVIALKQLYKYYVTERGLRDIPFNFLVGADGTVYEARGWKAQSSKMLKYYSEYHGNRIDFAFLGDYTTIDYPLEMMTSVYNAVHLGIEEGYVERFHDIFEYRDEKKLLDAIAEEKYEKPWENWQVQKMAEKIFQKKMDFWEADEKLKYLIPKENRPANVLCVIL